MSSPDRVRGTGTYTRELIESLERYNHNHSYTFFTRGTKIPNDIDIIHIPYFSPFFLTLPFSQFRPTVVTVHDLIPLEYPRHFPKGVRGSLKWSIQRWLLSQQAQVITDSDSSKRAIDEFVSIGGDRVTVIPLAPGALFGKTVSSGLRDTVRRKYSLPDAYLLYVGDVNWNKNVLGLLGAFARLRKEKRFGRYALVLVGSAFTLGDLPQAQEIARVIHHHGLGRFIIRPGYVPDEDLAAIYQMAAVYVQPSFAEGFGLPVLEAMESGCPVVVSDGTGLGEIAGPAIRIDPTSIESLRNGIMTVLTMGAEQLKNLREKQRDWSGQFRWQGVAKKTVRVYEAVLERCR